MDLIAALPARSSRIAAFALFFLVSGAGARAAAPQPQIAVSPKVVEEAPARPVRFESGVLGYQGLTYARRPGYRPLTLDLYLQPRSAAGHAKLPLVIYIHGGGWQGGSPKLSGAMSDFPSVLASLARRGYVVASLSYRFSSEAKFPAAPADIRAGIRWLKDHADQYGIDVTRTGVWGASAGGQLAALAATACTDASFDEGPNGAGPSPCVQAAVIWYGVLDFSTIRQQADKVPGAQPHRGPSSGESRYLGCDITQCPADRIALASPIAHVDSNDPPMLLIAGTADQTVPPDQSRTMAAALEKAHVSHELILIPNVNHSFIGKTPEQTRAATLRAIGATFDFFDRELKGK